MKNRMHQYAERSSAVVEGDRNSFIGKSYQKLMDKQYGSTQRPPKNSPKPESDYVYQEEETTYRHNPLLTKANKNRSSIYANSQRAMHLSRKYNKD